MLDEFEIPVTYKNKELQFPARLLMRGYTYAIETTIGEVVILFEPDEERNFRAILPPETDVSKLKMPDTELVQTVAEALTVILK
jgi:hypothetical protein